MSEWANIALSDIADIRFSNVDKKSIHGEVPVRLCNYMDVYANDYITANLQFMEASASHAEIERFKVECGDVIVTKDSETPDDIGIPAVVVNEIANLVCGYHLALIKPHREKVDAIYLAKQLGSKPIAARFAQLANGSTRYGLSSLAIASTSVPLAPLVQQRRIAEILSTLDEAIEQTEELIAKHQHIKAGLMHDLFTRGVTPDGHLRPTREQAPDLYKESPLGWIPREWAIVQLSSLAQFITSGSRGWAEYYSEAGPLFIRIGNLSREHINFRWDSVVRVDLPKFTEGQRTAVMPGDILISITADLGIVAVANDTLVEAYVNQHIALIRPVSNGLSTRFLGHFLTTSSVQNQFIRLNDSGAKAGLNLPAVGRILAVQPQDDSESIQIASMIDACDCNIESHKVEIAKIRQQKHGLMHDLLTGTVRVKIEQASVGSADG
jgi:type I restriction enzyme S subunit